MHKSFGLMQGRLTPSPKGKIQFFPVKNWTKEFSNLKALSLNRIEWTLDQKGLMKNPIMSKKGQKKINQLCKKHNVKIDSITGDCFMQKPFWKYQGYKKKKLISQLRKIITYASKLKIKYLVFPVVDNGKIENPEQEKILIEELKNLTQYLKINKVQILFETDMKPKAYLTFISNFKKKYFGINYDIGNSASNNFDPKEEFKYYGSRIKNIHIKDREKYGKTVPLGEGNANFKMIARLCKKINYKGNYILQAARKKNENEIKTIESYLKFLNYNFCK